MAETYIKLPVAENDFTSLDWQNSIKNRIEVISRPILSENKVVTVDGTALGIITVATNTNFNVGNYVGVIDDNTAVVYGYITAITLIGGPAYEITVETLPVGGVVVDLSAYDVIDNARIYTVPVVLGDRFIIANLGGDWSGFAIGDIVEYSASGWLPTTPNEGFATWDETANEVAVYNGSSWSALVAGIPPIGASTNNAMVRWNGLLGDTVKDSLIIVDDLGNISLPASATIDGIDLSAWPQVTNTIYVDNKRTDSYTPDGSVLRPFLTIQAAIDSITLPSATNKHVIEIAPGSYYSDPIAVNQVYTTFRSCGLQGARISGKITITNPMSPTPHQITFVGLRISGGLECLASHTTINVIDCNVTGSDWIFNPTVPTGDEYMQVFSGLWYANATLTNVYTYIMGGGYYSTFTVDGGEFNINNADINDPFVAILTGTSPLVASAFGNRASNSKFTLNAGADLHIDSDTEGGSVITMAGGTLSRSTKDENIINTSTVIGTTIKDALNTLAIDWAKAPIYDVTNWDSTGTNNLIADSGVTDNAPRLLALLTAIPTCIPTIVRFPLNAGLGYPDYNFNTTVTADLTGKIIRFEAQHESGGNCTLTLDSNPSGNGFVFVGGFLEFKNFNMRSPSAPVGSAMISYTTSADVVVPYQTVVLENVSFTGGYYGIKAFGAIAGLAFKADNVRLKQIQSGGAGIYIGGYILPPYNILVDIKNILMDTPTAASGSGIYIERGSGVIERIVGPTLSSAFNVDNVLYASACQNLEIKNINCTGGGAGIVRGIAIEGGINIKLDNLKFMGLTGNDIEIIGQPLNLSIGHYHSSKANYSGIVGLSSHLVLGDNDQFPSKLSHVSGIVSRNADIVAGIGNIQSIGRFTFAGNCAAGDTFTLNGTLHTFQTATPTGANQLRVGSSPASAANRLHAYFTIWSDQRHNFETRYTAGNTYVDFYSKIPGIAGNVAWSAATATPGDIVLDGGGFLGGQQLGVDAIDNITIDANTGDINTVGSVDIGGRHVCNITSVNAATYDVLDTDYILHVIYTGTGAVTNLKLMTAQVVEGRILIIKDAGGNASANSITITTEGAETIDGANDYTISVNYEAITLYCDGTNWFIV